MFDKDKFLEHIMMSLRALAVDLTTVGAPKNIITKNEVVGNYHAIIYGYTPDYEGQKQPAYKVDFYIYPDKKTMYVQDNSYDHPIDRKIFSKTGGRYPVIDCLRSHGFVGMGMENWQVEII